MASDAVAQTSIKHIKNGLRFEFKTAQVELVAATPEALRLSVIYNHQTPINSSFLARNEIRSLLRRRDAIVQHFEKLIAERGESAVLFSSLPSPATQ